MTLEQIVGSFGVLIVIVTVALILLRRMPKRVQSKYYVGKWREIQKMCSNKDDWAHAVIHADMLLDEILVKRKIAGKTTGERMVSAQKRFTTNDSLWDAHKLANSLRHDAEQRITKAKIKDALVAFRQALRDLGAL